MTFPLAGPGFKAPAGVEEKEGVWGSPRRVWEREGYGEAALAAGRISAAEGQSSLALHRGR